MNARTLVFLYLSIFFLLTPYAAYGDQKGQGVQLPDGWDKFRRRNCEVNPIPNEEVERMGGQDYILIIIGIIDGDSICGQDEGGYRYQIRLDGIDAPEYRQSSYFQAKQALAEMIYNQQICVTVKGVDRYNRIIGRLYFLAEGECLKEEGSVNLSLVKKGWAWMYRYFFEEGYYFSQRAFEEAEFNAKKNRLGLWQDPNPQNPYECRRNKKKCR